MGPTAADLGASLLQWNHGPARNLDHASAYIHGLCMQLRAAGMDIRRANLLVRTQQPQLEMLVYIWRPTEGQRVVVDTTNAVVGSRLDQDPGGEVETVLLAMGHTDEATWKQSTFCACLQRGAATSSAARPRSTARTS